MLVVLLSVRVRFSPGKRKKQRHMQRGTIEMRCSVCQRRLVFHRGELEPLSPPELALAVRANRSMAGRRLAEYVCPHCEAAHCFATEGRDPVWLGVNLYEPQVFSNHCRECKRPLRRPRWPRGAYDGRLSEIRDLAPDLGLVCPHCKAVCCVACCEDATRKRTKDGSLLCPRCFRGPVETIYHF